MFTDKAEHISLAFEDALPPEPHVTAKGREICQAFQHGKCRHGETCPERHVISQFKTMRLEVCRHWLRGACVNGENCPYLHEYDDRYVPACAFYQRLGECTNPECPFQHVIQTEKQPECAAYRRGFCPLGPQCHLRHVFRQPCPFYLAGFCPLGPKCIRGHPVQELYNRNAVSERLRQRMLDERADDPTFNKNATCYRCFDPGHLSPNCPGVQNGILRRMLMALQEPGEQLYFQNDGRSSRKCCFFCGDEGHEAASVDVALPMPWEPALGRTALKSLVKEGGSSVVEGGGALRNAMDAIVDLQAMDQQQQQHLRIPLLRRGYRALFCISTVLNGGKCSEVQEHRLTGVMMELVDMLNRSNAGFSSGVAPLPHECLTQCPFFCPLLTENVNFSVWAQNPWFHFVDHYIRFCLPSGDSSGGELSATESSAVGTPPPRPGGDDGGDGGGSTENECFHGLGYDVNKRRKENSRGSFEAYAFRHCSQVAHKCVEEFVHAEISYLRSIAGGIPAPPQATFNVEECGDQDGDGKEEGGMPEISMPCTSQGQFERLFHMDRIYFVAAVADACVSSDVSSCLTSRGSGSVSSSRSSISSGTSGNGVGCGVDKQRHTGGAGATRCRIACFVNGLLEAHIICTIIRETAAKIDVVQKETKESGVSGGEGRGVDDGDGSDGEVISLIIRGSARRTDALLDSLTTSLRDWLESSRAATAPASHAGIGNFYERLGGILLASYRSLEICSVSVCPGADDIFPHLVALCALLRSGPWLYSVLCWCGSGAAATFSWRSDKSATGGAYYYARTSFQAALLHVMQSPSRPPPRKRGDEPAWGDGSIA